MCPINRRNDKKAKQKKKPAEAMVKGVSEVAKQGLLGGKQTAEPHAVLFCPFLSLWF
jgi:hypothetical protein